MEKRKDYRLTGAGSVPIKRPTPFAGGTHQRAARRLKVSVKQGLLGELFDIVIRKGNVGGGSACHNVRRKTYE